MGLPLCTSLLPPVPSSQPADPSGMTWRCLAAQFLVRCHAGTSRSFRGAWEPSKQQRQRLQSDLSVSALLTACHCGALDWLSPRQPLPAMAGLGSPRTPSPPSLLSCLLARQPGELQVQAGIPGALGCVRRGKIHPGRCAGLRCFRHMTHSLKPTGRNCKVLHFPPSCSCLSLPGWPSS